MANCRNEKPPEEGFAGVVADPGPLRAAPAIAAAIPARPWLGCVRPRDNKPVAGGGDPLGAEAAAAAAAANAVCLDFLFRLLVVGGAALAGGDDVVAASAVVVSA